MLDRVVTQSGLLELIEELGHTHQLIGPVARPVPECDPPVRHFYQRVKHAGQLDLSFSYCTYSPKEFLFPPSETLFNFEKVDGRFTATPVLDEQRRALVGVHPCDVHAIELLDHVFAKDHADEHYAARRSHTFIIAIDCPTPCTSGVFCADMKTNTATQGYDVMLYPLATGDGANGNGQTRYGAVFGTEAGREWLYYNRRFTSPSAEDERSFKAYPQTKAAAFTRELNTTVDKLPALLDRSYDSLLWEATARRCYSCGSCNLVCPTCYCFDMHDHNELSETCGQRRREWDGCQLPEFAVVAGDHNFRPKAAQRLRHRTYRKAKWVKEQSGLAGCVGCARCDRACTAKISSVEVYNQLAEEA